MNPWSLERAAAILPHSCLVLLAGCYCQPELDHPGETSPPLRPEASRPGLPLAKEPTLVTVVQRRSALVPGSDGRLRLRISDITGGQALVELTTRGGKRLVPRRSMRVGEAEKFEYCGRESVLSLTRLRNFLIGDDFAEFHVGDAELVATTQIERMLERVENSGLIFVRNGEDHDAESAAAHLRQKYQASGASIRSSDEFIDRIATQSSTTSEPYLVRIGRYSQPLADWLRDKGWALPER